MPINEGIYKSRVFQVIIPHDRTTVTKTYSYFQDIIVASVAPPKINRQRHVHPTCQASVFDGTSR
jgi:hypothetical protein